MSAAARPERAVTRAGNTKTIKTLIGSLDFGSRDVAGPGGPVENLVEEVQDDKSFATCGSFWGVLRVLDMACGLADFCPFRLCRAFYKSKKPPKINCQKRDEAEIQQYLRLAYLGSGLIRCIAVRRLSRALLSQLCCVQKNQHETQYHRVRPQANISSLDDGRRKQGLLMWLSTTPPRGILPFLLRRRRVRPLPSSRTRLSGHNPTRRRQ
ncbi:hypothetical protein C8F04DRAFT_1364075 [Mycena alexandri]|uniref:Uncharacterized protein n=1 Tax=Mycena alexandri TaxID=1745969 RepID=A0AAD6SQE6_9AGAR|nr:hypothetical protein C8F04DRAFT_1364075 [Mycena alexandri]